MRAGYFAQSRLLCARDQNQTRAQRVGQGFDRLPVLGALLFKAGKRSKARGVALCLLPENRSRRPAIAAAGSYGRWARCQK